MSELRQKMHKGMVLRNLAPSTQESYIRSVYDLAKYYMRSPEQISDEQINDYLLYWL